MKQVIFYSKRVAAFALACFVVVFSIGFSSSAATVATDLHADINMNVEIKYTDGTFSQSDPELIGKTPFNVDPEDWAMAAPPVFSNKQISHVRVNTDLIGYQVPTTVIPPDPVSVIKAGTYRFNDVLTEPSADLEQSLHFSVHTYLPSISTECHFVCSEIGVGKSDVSCGFYVETASLDLSSVGFNFPQYVSTYGNGAWKSNLFGEGIKTITIPNDTEVSFEFLTWFTANTVQQKQIHGKWKFKDVIDYSGSGLDGYVDFDCNTVIDGFGNVLFRCSLIGVNEALPDGTPVRVAYMVESSTPDISSALGVTFPIPIAGLYRGGWDTSTYGEGIKTIDFGTEPQTVSAEFYNWLLANAVPLDQVIPDDPESETPAPVVGKTVQMRVFYRVELGLAKDAVSSISVNSGTRSGTVWTPLPYTTISSKYATDTSTGSSYIDATIQFTLPADSEVLRVYGTFYTSPFTASNIGEVVGGVQVCEFLYLDPVTDQDPSDKVEVDRIDGVVSDKLDQTGQITDTIEQLQKPSVDVNGSGAPVIGGMVVDPMEQVDLENFGSYTSVIGAIFGSGTILGYFIIAFSMIFISYVIFGKSG